MGIGEGSDFIHIARNNRGRPDDFGKALEIELVLRQRQTFGIVQYDDTALFGEPTEQDAGMDRPGPCGLVERGIVAQHQSIDLLDIHGPPFQRLVLKSSMKRFGFLVFRLRQHRGMDRQAVIRTQGKVTRRQIDNLMAAIERRHGQQAGCKIRPLGFNRIDEKCDTHEAPPIMSRVRQWIFPPGFFPDARWPWPAAGMRA